MSNVKLTHVKTLRNPNFIGSYVLMTDDGEFKDLTVKITEVKKELIQKGDSQDEETVVYLENQKPFILNKTNEKSLIKFFSTPFVEKWIGKSFTLEVKQVRAFGETHNALRIKTDIIQTLAVKSFGPDSPKWEGALKALKLGNITIKKLKETRSISTEDEAVLQKAENESKLL